MDKEKSFIVIPDAADGGTLFLNVDLIRTLTFNRDGVRIAFSETHYLTLQGPVARAFVKRFADRATTLHGEPIDLPLVDEAG